MNVLKGIYRKKDENREVELYVLAKKEEHTEGIDLTKLTPEERKEFINIVQEFESKINKFVKKAFRSFINENFEELKNKVIIGEK